MSTGSYFDKGMPVQPWSLRVSNGSDTTRITTVPVETVGGRVKVSAVDDTVQEGARRFVFDGSGKAAVQITSEGAVDCLARSEWRRHVVSALRRDADVPKDVKLGMACGAGCGGTLDVADTLSGLPPASGRPSVCRSSASRKPAST
jgi:beta-glucosidase